MNSFFSRQAGCNVRWQDLPGHGDPVVFIHGLGCAASYEYPRVVCDPAFGKRRAILIDLPGSGYSDKPEHYDYRTSSQANVVAELLEHLNIQQFWLYGHSMGGSIAIETAELTAGKIRGLAVSEPNFRAGGGAFSRDIAAQDEAEFVASGYHAMLEDETSAWAGSLRSNAPYAVWRGSSSLVAGVKPAWNARFLTLSCPVTLIFGEHSLPDRDERDMREAGVRVVVLDGVGHSMSWEDPAALANAIATSLS